MTKDTKVKVSNSSNSSANDITEEKNSLNQLLKDIAGCKYERKSTRPFIKPDNLFYFVKTASTRKVECIYFLKPSFGITDHARHHIISASGSLKSVWEKWRTWSKMISDKQDKCLLIRPQEDDTLRAFENYIKEAGKYIKTNTNVINSAEEVREALIWNPGNLVLGPKYRPHSDPETARKFDSDEPIRCMHNRKIEYSEYLEWIILVNMSKSRREEADEHLHLIAKALESINAIQTPKIINNLNEAMKEAMINEAITEPFTKFWDTWLRLLKGGYVVYLWTQSIRSLSGTYSPSHYCFNIATDVKDPIGELATRIQGVLNEYNKMYP